MNAPVGITTARDETAKGEILQKIKEVIPEEKKIQDILKGLCSILHYQFLQYEYLRS